MWVSGMNRKKSQSGERAPPGFSGFSHAIFSLWNELTMDQTTNLYKYIKDHFDFWMALGWFFRFRLGFFPPFRWALICLYLKLESMSHHQLWDVLLERVNSPKSLASFTFFLSWGGRKTTSRRRRIFQQSLKVYLVLLVDFLINYLFHIHWKNREALLCFYWK